MPGGKQPVSVAIHTVSGQFAGRRHGLKGRAFGLGADFGRKVEKQDRSAQLMRLAPRGVCKGAVAARAR